MQAVLGQIRSLLGADAVIDGVRAESKLGNCTTGLQSSIAAMVYPGDLQQVVSVVKLAGEHGVALYPVSTGHNWGYGIYPVTDGCIVLNLSRMNRIVEPVDPLTGLTTLEPGVTQADLAAYLEREHLPFLVPTTGAGPSTSIVGNALERGHAITPISDHFSAVLGIEAVLPDGSIYRSPHRAMGASSGGHAFKWGIGPYLDGLFAQGNFGVVTKMSLVLARRPERIKAFVCGLGNDSSLENAVLAVQAILERLPGVVGGINIMNAHRVLAMATAYPRDRLAPNEVIPDALLKQLRTRHRVAAWTVFGTLYGTKRVIATAQKEVRRALSPLIAPLATSRLMFMRPETADTLHRTIQRLPILRRGLGRTLATLSASMTIVSGRPNQTALPLAYWRSGRTADLTTELDPARDGCGLIWYAPVVDMKPDAVRRHVDMIRELLPRHGLEPLITLMSVSQRCFVSTVPLLFDLASKDRTAAAHSCLSALLDAGAEQGFFPYRLGIQSMDWLMSKGREDYWRVVSKLKQAIDPRGIVSPGRYAPIVRNHEPRSSATNANGPPAL